ncbi:hypothetical protein NLJ89_g5835 [Agrocybe chaxingu]|uniref:Uncharacterized protein n=1 Tax=Agrocybe chaxingu TaxID=84603 RepID=A0A9W8K1S2_9AGAR|nr:hypothetical protein NLJ89_g5835 [Agrocybe chaxingu]
MDWTNAKIHKINDTYSARTPLGFYSSDADIRVFLEYKFGKLKEEHPLKGNFAADWSSHTEYSRLLQLCLQGGFVYASVVMRYLESTWYYPPTRLSAILNLQQDPTSTSSSIYLDALYRHIFSSLANLPQGLDVLTVVILHRGSRMTPKFVEDLLISGQGHVQSILTDLEPLVLVPQSTNDLREVTVCHGSVREFLLDPKRSGRFFIDSSTAYGKLAVFCMKRLRFQQFVPHTEGISPIMDIFPLLSNGLSYRIANGS